MVNLSRITFDPQVMGGKPCIRGMRVTVGTIVGLIASGKTVDQVLADYPYLEREAIGTWVIAALKQYQNELELGAIITIEPQRARVRILPFTS